MSADHVWVTDVASEYSAFCSNVMLQNSGVNAMLNVMYNTHGFEGEIKKDIEDFCDQMAVKAGVYGQFALTCAGQDDLMSISNREDVQKLFADTVISLYDRKDKALKGYDNYCYITGTILTHETIHATANSTIYYKDDPHYTRYDGFTAAGWSITVPAIVDSVYAQVLYDQYYVLNEDKESFKDYLKAYGAGEGTFSSDKLMTRFGGTPAFALSEGIRMQCDAPYRGGSYFKSGEYYNIDVGTGGDVDPECYHLHDKMIYDNFDISTGTPATDQVAAARALYGENHWYWVIDEAYFFSTGISTYNTTYDHSSEDRWQRDSYTRDFDVLKRTQVHDKKDKEDPENPFFAFGAPSLPKGVYDNFELQYEDTKKALTDVVLETGPFFYSGEAVEPTVAVKTGKKYVPSSGYTVSYNNNEDIGYGTITIKGKENYSGIIQRQFKIVPNGTAISKLKKKNNTVTVKWNKQTEKTKTASVAGYQIRYSTKSSMNKAKKVTVKGALTTSTKVKGLKKHKKYYFQVRTYVNTGKGAIYSPWSKKKSVRIK